MELTNHQRTFFGLNLVESGWDRVEYPFGYTVYYNKNRIVKIIISSDSIYSEYDTDEETNNRQTILPRTAKGKEKKLNYTSLSSVKGRGTLFDVDYSGGRYDDGEVKAVNLNTQIVFAERFEDESPVRNPQELQKWIEDYISNSPDNHSNYVQQHITAKRQHVKKIRPGDIYAWKVGRFEYAFVRILMYLPDVKKDNVLKLTDGRHGLNSVMAKSLLVQPIAYISSTSDIDPDLLADEPVFPSLYVMDNNVFYGQNPIIGNRKLREQYLDFPISFGRSTYQVPNHYLQWGFGHIEKESNDRLWEIHRTGHDMMGYRNDATGFGIFLDKAAILNRRQNAAENSHSLDLRMAHQKETLKAILKAFGFSADTDYMTITPFA